MWLILTFYTGKNKFSTWTNDLYLMTTKLMSILLFFRNLNLLCRTLGGESKGILGEQYQALIWVPLKEFWRRQDHEASPRLGHVVNPPTYSLELIASPLCIEVGQKYHICLESGEIFILFLEIWRQLRRCHFCKREQFKVCLFYRRRWVEEEA